MIVVDRNAEVMDWINELGSENLSCVRLDLITFEIASGLQTELILIHHEVLNEANSMQLKKLSECAGVVVYVPKKSDSETKLINLLGVVSHNDHKADCVNILVNIEARIKSENILKSQLISLNNELNEIMGGVEDQLFRVKHTYERMVPKRLEQFKGIKIFSKYAAGEKSGGEFFDLYSNENKIFLMMSHTSSYIASSVILQQFGAMKGSPRLTGKNLDAFFQTIKDEVAQLAKAQDKEITIKLLTLVLDTSSMEIECKSLGKFDFISSHGREVETSESDKVISQHLQLERGERLMVCTPGFEYNWSEVKTDIEISKLMENSEIKPLDVLDELFFQLKKKSGSEFLKSDAAAIIMEVEKNVMVQI